MSQKPKGLSVFFPAYNDSGTIASLVIAAVQTARRLTSDFEVLVINDGSADATAAVADELARLYPQVRVVHHPKNRGYGGALRSGFANATKEVIFYTDGDAQYDPREMALLWERFGDDVDLVNGYKISRSDPLHRILIGRTLPSHGEAAVRPEGARRGLRLPHAAPVRSSTASALEKSSGVICLEMMTKIQEAGFRIAEVPVHHYHRAVRQVAVLQLPAHRPHGRRRAEALVAPGGPARTRRRPPPRPVSS